MKKLFRGSFVVAAALFLAACASTPPNPFVGVWDISIDTPVGVMGANLNIAPDLTGNMSSDDLGGATPLDNISVVDNAVSFSASVDAQGMTLTLNFEGTIAGDTLAGNFDTEFGAIPVTGVRQ